jgi:hypothetical protein
LTCSASPPCPAEMGGSIHIHGTASSILDTVFVCRDRGAVRRAWLFDDAEDLAGILAKEIAELRAAGMKPTAGDIRCMALGHMTRMAIWRLRPSWDATLPTGRKLTICRKAMDALASVASVTEHLGAMPPADAFVGGLFAKAEGREAADATSF